jgi:hypothetical protein
MIGYAVAGVYVFNDNGIDMKNSAYKFKTSTIIKIYVIGIIINSILWIPYYCFAVTTSKSLLLTIPVGVIIFILTHRYFIYTARKSDKDLTKPI